jgi:hypothetical protein
MATIRQKAPEQWHAQIRRRGWPVVTATTRTRKNAEAFSRDIEGQMDRGTFVDRTAAERATLSETLERYRRKVTDKRPGEPSRIAERARIQRFIRDEPKLCAFAMSNLRPEHFEEYRDRRLVETVQRGKVGGRGQYKPDQPKARAFA